MKKDKLIIDLDNTITIDFKNHNYPEKILNEDVKKAIEKASSEYEIVIFTARNMLTHEGNLEKILSLTKPVAVNWLKKNEVYYDEIIFGKPFCGKNGYYIDDKNISIDEFLFKFSGPFCDFSVDIVIPFYNEEKNILNVYDDVKRMERLFHIKNFIFVDNGSNDNSKKIFNDLKERDHKIKILEIEKNIGYGYGIKKGLLESKSDYILINHSDGQFDTFSYFMTHLYEIKNMIIADSIFSFRINRPFKQKLITYILRLFLSFLNFKKIKEFNGQPKLVKNIFDLHECSKLPNDFSLDYAIYNRIKPKIFFPVIQKSRKEGESSWAGSALRSIKVLKMYIKQSFR